MSKIRHETVALDDLKPYPGNARRGNLEVIKESLTVHGQYRSLVVQESTGFVLAGNHTVEAARQLGWDSLDVGIIDCDDETAKKIVLVDNRSNDLATYDESALADLLTELESFDATGFEQQDLDALLASLGPGGFRQSQLDQVIKVPNDPVTQQGEIINLGPHTLICDDCLSGGYQSLDTMDMVWSDPPDLSELKTELAYTFRSETAKIIYESLKPGGVYYCFGPPGPDMAYWINAFEQHNLKPQQILQWVKDSFVFETDNYHYRSEPILYGWREGESHQWNGGRSQDSVWEFDRPKRAKEHPTIKPAELAIRAIENSSEKGDTVFDPFAGSGTIMVAAMQTGRKTVMVEIDPAYCDVIIERYERLTGDKVRRQ